MSYDARTLNYDDMVNTRQSVYDNLGLTKDTPKNDARLALCNWVIENIPWSKDAAIAKDDFIQTGPLVFEGATAYTIGQGLIDRSADCVGQANTLEFLSNGLDLQIKTSGYLKPNGAGHRIATWVNDDGSSVVFDASLCQSYRDTIDPNIPDRVIAMPEEYYVSKNDIDIEASTKRNTMKFVDDKLQFNASNMNEELIKLACDDIPASYLASGLTDMMEEGESIGIN